MATVDIILLVVAGLGAGFVNTLAGNGSLITLTLLMEFIGLSPLVANGTNRVGILLHSIIASYTMKRQHGLDQTHSKIILPVMLIGGITGGILSVIVSPEQFKMVYRILLVLLFITLLINPKRWLQPDTIKFNLPKFFKLLLLFGVGVYGGFIQMGMGIILLATLVLIFKLPLMKANTIKLFSVLIYMPFVFILLIYHDLVNWKFGLLLAVGQVIGGWMTARYISNWKHANTLAYGLLILMVSAALIKVFLLN